MNLKANTGMLFFQATCTKNAQLFEKRVLLIRLCKFHFKIVLGIARNKAAGVHAC